MYNYLLSSQFKRAAVLQVPSYLRGSYTNYGGIRRKPDRDINAKWKVGLTIIPGILLGGYIAKKLAYFLELSELFSPDDEDDEL